MPNVYEYQSLPEGDYIRVLILNPGTDDEPLSGDLRVVQLVKPDRDLHSAQEAHVQSKTSSKSEVIRWTADIPFEAISYVWGLYEKDHIIFLSGKTHQITANLSDALHQCRLPDQPRTLWADSICISQENSDEKNHQVYMMGRIYASSQRTLICLGTHPEYRDHAQNATALISDINGMIQGVFQRPGFSWELDSFPRPLATDQLVNDSRWQSIEILFQNPWFERGWVVQEAAMAREARILWTGSNIALLDLLKADVWYWKRAVYVTQKPDNHTTLFSTPTLLRQILYHKLEAESRVFYRGNGHLQHLDLLYTLAYARRLHLSDPRDRIYAFMALPIVRNPMPNLRPDYDKSHVNLYQEFAVRYLEETSDLNILIYVTPLWSYELSAGTDHGSSWVPRWDYLVWERYGCITRDFGQKSTKPNDYAVLHEENGTLALLQVRAIIFDSIRLVSKRLDRRMAIEDVVTVWSQFTERGGSASRQAEFSSACESLIFLKALTAGFYTFEEVREDRATALKSYATFLRTNEQGTGSQGSRSISPDMQSCHRQLMSLARRSCVFKLERGYFGLGLWRIKPGDICAFVFGVSLPLILRKSPDELGGACHYNVIGPAFVVSMVLDEQGLPCGLGESQEWSNWGDLCEKEGWADWGLKEERIILN